jgi:hypothetical protein
MVSKASENVTASGLPQAVFQEANMTELPLPDCSADVVISNGAINLAEDSTPYWRKCFGCCGPVAVCRSPIWYATRQLRIPPAVVVKNPGPTVYPVP